MRPACSVATLIEHYFTDRLLRQRNVSPNTIASHRDTFRLLFTFAQARLGKSPSDLALSELDAPFIGAFLLDLETNRGASTKPRNLRLTAIRCFFRFVSFEEPAHSALIQRVLAIPSKRHDTRQVHFLTRPEIEAILATPDRTTWLGRRDHTLLLIAVQTGLRLSELIGLDREAVHLGDGAHVRCVGKGRKERTTPLTTLARRTLQAWLKEPVRKGGTALFPNVHGGRLSADSVQSMLAKHVHVAGENCPSLRSTRVSPHVLRHYVASRIMWGTFGSIPIPSTNPFSSRRHSFDHFRQSCRARGRPGRRRQFPNPNAVRCLPTGIDPGTCAEPLRRSVAPNRTMSRDWLNLRPNHAVINGQNCRSHHVTLHNPGRYIVPPMSPAT